MNLFTLRHGPQPDGSVKAGSLELLATAEGEASLPALTQPLRTLEGVGAAQVDAAREFEFPLEYLDLVIMNPPFTNNQRRGRKYGVAAVKRMQRHELGLRDDLEQYDPTAGGLIDANSVRTFFTPLADRILQRSRGTLAMVLPVTACTGASGSAERRFLAERFHIERIITTHDPRRTNFSYNTSIHECLLICRRHSGGARPPTQFISLRRMPESAEEAVEAADTVASGDANEWGRMHGSVSV